MFNIGDKVLFRQYEDMEPWKFGIFEIGEIKTIFQPMKIGKKLLASPFPEYRYSLKYKSNAFGRTIDVYGSLWYSEDEFITLKESRRLKLEKINERV